MPSQPGKIAVVTGGNNGIGYETALGLAKKDIEVILACRNLLKAEEAKSNILSEYPKAKVKIMKVDVSRLREVREFANQFQK